MAYYVFNIGLPATSEWWAQNLDRKVITAGYKGQSGDRGDIILNQLIPGDWVIAYVNGHGYVGAGIVLGYETYRLHLQLPSGSLSDHRHERAVDWRYFVEDISHAVNIDEANRQQPRQTKESIDSEKHAERMIGEIQARSGDRKGRHGRLRWELVREAVFDLGRAVSVAEVRALIAMRDPQFNSENIRPDLEKMSVNSDIRAHYQGVKKGRRSDSGHAADRLFKTFSFSETKVRYEPYIPEVHGVWILEYDFAGNGKVYQAPQTLIAHAATLARREVDAIEMAPIDSELDGRKRVLMQVAMRQGQFNFRSLMLVAYEEKCAVTGCSTVDVLEAAHIIPYRGIHTNRTDNGLLLRSDIHTLFDMGRLWIDPKTMAVRLASDMKNTDYWQYEGVKISLPKSRNDWPNPKHLTKHIEDSSPAK
ncbi:HNH endonuclease [Pseudomonas sp. RIT288]|uniref:HNH endonuclease n=1 Tax=Pseudomonas sp. RIT288 TaxID=1470589 RepID=UPI0004517A95|nr:HNH endonuclease [Pseudomonas sp. RIT288]EZP33267.1 putative restriction enzyme-related protein [Pseudomonas sp. RIT288]